MLKLLPPIDHTIEGHFRTMLRVMFAFFAVGIAWSVGMELGYLRDGKIATECFRIGSEFLFIALGMFRGMVPSNGKQAG
jgi:hypothetical protein